MNGKAPRSKNTNYITDGKYPPEMQQLIDKFDGKIGTAEKSANVSVSLFSKIKRGKEPYSDYIKGKIMTALAGKQPPKMEGRGPKDFSQTCPPLLADLIQHMGSKKAAMQALGTSDGTFYKVMYGKGEMPVEWIVRAKAELGLPVIGLNMHDDPEGDAPTAPQAPPFVPWNGKMVSVMVKGMPGSKPKNIKAPEPIAKLIERFGGSRGNAAAATGHTQGWLSPFLLDPKTKFATSEKAQRAIHDALHGIAPQEKMSQDFDKYSLGIAIVMVNGEKNFDRIQDVADILNGRMVFRKSTKIGWILMYKMATEDLPKFKKLAARDANEIVCP